LQRYHVPSQQIASLRSLLNNAVIACLEHGLDHITHNVRFWHKADIPIAPIDVRFLG
jgi:hypothetical protein